MKKIIVCILLLASLFTLFACKKEEDGKCKECIDLDGDLFCDNCKEIMGFDLDGGEGTQLPPMPIFPN